MAVNDYEVDIVNDISAGNSDKDMFDTVARLNVPYIMMHMKGIPRDMQANPEYDNVVEEIIQYFSEKIQDAKLSGICDIIIDPGITLSIAPGTYMKMMGAYKFEINGNFLAIGEPGDSIIFTINDTTDFANPDTTLGGWRGFEINSTGTRIEKCIIDHIKRGENETDFEKSGFILNADNIVIAGNRIHHNITGYSLITSAPKRPKV